MTENQPKNNEILVLSLNQIIPNINQPRQEFKEVELLALAQSIKEYGQLYPIRVISTEDGKYSIEDGERRWRAIKHLNENDNQESTIRVVCVKKSDGLQGIIANILREDYNPMERAESCKLLKSYFKNELTDKEATDKDIAKKIGKGRSTVTELLSLLKLPEIIQHRAKVDSCVPYGWLKRLAAEKSTDDEKIEKYDQLHDKYSAKNPNDENHNIKKIKSSMVQRKVQAATRKLIDISNCFDIIDIAQVDDATKQGFVAALEATISFARNYLDKISLPVDNVDASTLDRTSVYLPK